MCSSSSSRHGSRTQASIRVRAPLPGWQVRLPEVLAEPVGASAAAADHKNELPHRRCVFLVDV